MRAALPESFPHLTLVHGVRVSALVVLLLVEDLREHTLESCLRLTVAVLLIVCVVVECSDELPCLLDPVVGLGEQDRDRAYPCEISVGLSP